MKLDGLLGTKHKPIIALLIAHLLCKGSITRASSRTENSSIKEVLGIEQLSTKTLYSALDYLEVCNFEIIEDAIFDYWKKLTLKDKDSFVLDVTDTYYNGKHDNSAPRKGEVSSFRSSCK